MQMHPGLSFFYTGERISPDPSAPELPTSHFVLRPALTPHSLSFAGTPLSAGRVETRLLMLFVGPSNLSRQIPRPFRPLRFCWRKIPGTAGALLRTSLRSNHLYPAFCMREMS